MVREELLPKDQRERLARDGYLVGGHGGAEPSVVPLTMLGAGLVTCALLALISPDGADAPPSYLVDGFFGDALEMQNRLFDDKWTPARRYETHHTH